MTENAIFRCITEYVVNCAWQIPLLAAGAWFLVKAMRPGVLVQHGLWLSVLALAVLLPLRGLEEWQPARQSAIGRPISTPTATRKTELLSMEPDVVEKVDTMRSHYDVPLPGRGHRLVISQAATRWLVAMYALSILFGGWRFVRGLLSARRIVRGSCEATLDEQTMNVFEESCRQLKVAMPQVRESDKIDGPVIVRALRPLMILPLRFEKHAEDEVRAALLHELAHVRRRDYLVNLVCQIAALPVMWHPAVHGIQQRIRRTREMLCDALAAGEMASGAEYARCLVSLARQMLNNVDTGIGAQAVSLFERNTMEERVMKLTETKVVMSGRARMLRGGFGCAAMLLMASAAATVHLRPTFAAAVSGAAPAKAADLQGAVPAVAQVPVVQAKPAEASTAPVAIEPAQTENNSGLSSPPVEDDGPKATAGEGSYVHRWVGADGKRYVMANRNPNEPTTEERLKEAKKLEDSQRHLDKMQGKLDESKMTLQMDELQKRLDGVQMKAQLEAAERLANDPAMKLRMDELEKKLSRLDAMPELKKFNDPAWQREFAELQKSQSALNGDLDKQMALASSAMKDQEEQMATLQKQMDSGELKAKLDEATRLLEEVTRKMEAMQAK